MRIALVLESPHQAGGVFQHIISTVRQFEALTAHEIVVLTPLRANLEHLRNAKAIGYHYRFGVLRRFLTRLSARSNVLKRVLDRLPHRIRDLCGPLDIELRSRRVDLTFFFHSSLPLYVHSAPYVAIVYDLCHRDWPEFPEVSAQFEGRERIFLATLPRALAVIVSSPSLGRAVCRYYGVNESRVVVLPFTPALHTRERATPDEIARVRAKFGLHDEYIFYPAQFWPHKNHVYLLESLQLLATIHSIRIHAVLSGSNFGNRAHVKAVAVRLGLIDRIHFVGFVADEDMAPLYSGARALVMPTYFGPTNLPPLEAMAVGCPVIYSDLAEFREDFGDAALYCDLSAPASLVEKLRLVLGRSDIVEKLNHAARLHLERSRSIAHNERLKTVLDGFDYTRRRWSGD